MADVRSLLRQQRDARRIQHPLAAYSDAGKLLCTLCREQIRADSMWDSHLQGASHKQKAATGARQATRDDAGAANPKRKLQESSEATEFDEASRTKRTKAELLAAGLLTTESDEDASEQQPAQKDRVRTPPSLIRRMSTTPSQGIEIQIPSRPATPAHRDSSSSSTPGGSSLPSAFATAGATAVSSRMQSAIPAAADTTTTASAEETPILASGNGVDEDEWAAFEADIAAASVPFDEDATITAPAMNAEEAAAAASGDADSEDVKRKMQADIDIEDEKEEATRAMEDEFDDMQELEARVQRLKDQRAALRQRAESQGQETMPPKPSDLAASAAGAVAANGTVVEEEEDSDDEDDFDGFTFRR
ncbi:hypothetical protein VHEMI00292 [[Torrubiella] hemipterigena]|uniref:Coiled-coil domain-containing protein 16 n=1 Tax=[Torrubiella] hemipterigena TaxID=1531966 RepID=A0A0A1T1I4_9HYPO|nr:hypothetical protein VHEMI00292 [[Torrubiella] hemipterigena]